MVKRYFSYNEINELALNEPTKPAETTEMHYFKVVKKEPLTVQGINESGITNVFILKPGWRMGYASGVVWGIKPAIDFTSEVKDCCQNC